MSLLLAIDPGVDTGWATFHDGYLQYCGLGAWPSTFQYGPIVMEYPQVYPRMNPKVANDLIKLAIQVGRYVERLGGGGNIELVQPHTWKGSIDKAKHHARLRSVLMPSELDMLEKYLPMHVLASKRHNVWDAVALGAWKLGRLPKSGFMNTEQVGPSNR